MNTRVSNTAISLFVAAFWYVFAVILGATTTEAIALGLFAFLFTRLFLAAFFEVRNE